MLPFLVHKGLHKTCVSPPSGSELKAVPFVVREEVHGPGTPNDLPDETRLCRLPLSFVRVCQYRFTVETQAGHIKIEQRVVSTLEKVFLGGSC